MLEQLEFLRNIRNFLEQFGVLRRPNAFDKYFAFIRRVNTGQNLDESAFPGAVFSHNTVDPAALHSHIHVAKRDDTRKSFKHIFRFENDHVSSARLTVRVRLLSKALVAFDHFLGDRDHSCIDAVRKIRSLRLLPERKDRPITLHHRFGRDGRIHDPLVNQFKKLIQVVEANFKDLTRLIGFFNGNPYPNRTGGITGDEAV